MLRHATETTGITLASGAFMLFALFGAIDPAQAVPSYARQTGQECIACHVSFPELTPYGRYFKLTGYTIGKTSFSSEGMNYLPLAMMAQASVTNTRNNNAIDPQPARPSRSTRATTASSSAAPVFSSRAR